jgi:hypothetical protein
VDFTGKKEKGRNKREVREGRYKDKKGVGRLRGEVEEGV